MLVKPVDDQVSSDRRRRRRRRHARGNNKRNAECKERKKKASRRKNQDNIRLKTVTSQPRCLWNTNSNSNRELIVWLCFDAGDVLLPQKLPIAGIAASLPANPSQAETFQPVEPPPLWRSSLGADPPSTTSVLSARTAACSNDIQLPSSRVNQLNFRALSINTSPIRAPSWRLQLRNSLVRH